MGRCVLALVVCVNSAANSLSFPTEDIELTQIKPKISIVVDDLGDNSIIAKQIANLPAILTLAILPHTPHARKISEAGAQHGHEVIMHLPMEALSRPDLLGPGALFEVMEADEFEETLLNDALTVPGLVGFNNHMGSLLTQNTEKMTLLMKLAKKNNWYFLDSKTSQSSVAQTMAEQINLPTIGRDIFLDHHDEKSELPDILHAQFEKVKRIARKRGHVVAICHPYKETYQFLLDNLSEIQQEFELVKLSDLMEKQLILEPDLIDPEIMIVEKLHKVEVEKAAEESLLN
jgi:polysaccharide deacetylase 2 family uncharacterized protein YibQ